MLDNCLHSDRSGLDKVQPNHSGIGIEHAPTRALHVVEILRERILSGVLQPGTPLQELPLAVELGVSRTPVRAALSVLSQEGLIAYLPQRGYQVRTWTLDDVMNAYEVRGVLEAAACARAASVGVDEATLELLKRCLTEVDEMLRLRKLPDAGLQRWRELNITFHQAILDSSCNIFFASALQTVRSIPLVVNAVVVWGEPGDLRAFHDDHHRIFDAIRLRQSERASYLMREHVYRAAEAIRQNYRERKDAKSPTVATRKAG
jgi:GntR family transcriptional regulator of vanillate catabolism